LIGRFEENPKAASVGQSRSSSASVRPVPAIRHVIVNCRQSSGPRSDESFSPTKIVALSDIHGNLAASDAILDDAHLQGADAIVNLGDIFSGALYPCQTADRLKPLRLPTIRGTMKDNSFPAFRLEWACRTALLAALCGTINWLGYAICPQH
jgi:Calcineurin-like phosphoesterase superfamily domain